MNIKEAGRNKSVDFANKGSNKDSIHNPQAQISATAGMTAS